ncbi:MAG: darcynin family protein [Phycicoccus sp.]
MATDTDKTAPATDLQAPANHVAFMLVRTTTTWLGLRPDERFTFLGETITPLLARHPTVRMRFFDSEAFTGEFSDVVMWETTDLLAYQALVEDLRETAFWGHYFEIRQIIPSIENAYARHYDVDPL